jgi:hypothetical protein
MCLNSSRNLLYVRRPGSERTVEPQERKNQSLTYSVGLPVHLNDHTPLKCMQFLHITGNLSTLTLLRATLTTVSFLLDGPLFSTYPIFLSVGVSLFVSTSERVFCFCSSIYLKLFIYLSALMCVCFLSYTTLAVFDNGVKICS